MTIPVEVLEAEVLSLPAPLRSRLLDKLIASLDTDPEWRKPGQQRPIDARPRLPAAKRAGFPAMLRSPGARAKLA